MDHDRCADIIEVRSIVCGNGSPGIADLVAEHERYIQQQIGSWKTIKTMMIFLGIANIGTLVTFLIKTFAK